MPKINRGYLNVAPITIFFCMFLYSDISFAGSTYAGGPLLGIASFPNKNDWLYFHVDVKRISNPPACMDTSKGYQYLIDTADDPSKTLLSNLQIAFSNYSQVWIFGTGKCNPTGSEYINSANVLSKSFPPYPTGATSNSLEGGFGLDNGPAAVEKLHKSE